MACRVSKEFGRPSVFEALQRRSKRRHRALVRRSVQRPRGGPDDRVGFPREGGDEQIVGRECPQRANPARPASATLSWGSRASRLSVSRIPEHGRRARGVHAQVPVRRVDELAERCPRLLGGRAGERHDRVGRRGASLGVRPPVTGRSICRSRARDRVRKRAAGAQPIQAAEGHTRVVVSNRGDGRQAHELAVGAACRLLSASSRTMAASSPSPRRSRNASWRSARGRMASRRTCGSGSVAARSTSSASTMPAMPAASALPAAFELPASTRSSMPGDAASTSDSSARRRTRASRSGSGASGFGCPGGAGSDD